MDNRGSIEIPETSDMIDKLDRKFYSGYMDTSVVNKDGSASPASNLPIAGDFQSPKQLDEHYTISFDLS